jgi:hypothetical protein
LRLRFGFCGAEMAHDWIVQFPTFAFYDDFINESYLLLSWEKGQILPNQIGPGPTNFTHAPFFTGPPPDPAPGMNYEIPFVNFAQADQPGPFQDPATGDVYMVGQIVALGVVRLAVYKRPGAPGNWPEADAAHAPQCSNDPVSAHYMFTGVCRDSDPTSSLLHIGFFHTDQTLRYVSFDMSTGLWGTPVGSSLTYNVALRSTGDPNGGFSAAHRSGEFFVAQEFEWINTGSLSISRVSYARFDTALAAWDSSLTRIGETDSTSPGFWKAIGAVTDASGNIHFFLQQNSVDDTGASDSGNRFSWTLWHQVLHTNGTLSTRDLVQPAIEFAKAAYARPIIQPNPGGAGEELVIPMCPDPNIYDASSSVSGDLQTGDVSVIRGIAGDSPTWTVQNVVDGTTFWDRTTFSFCNAPTGLALANIDGLLYLFLLGTPAGTSAGINLGYFTNTGPTHAWSGVTLAGHWWPDSHILYNRCGLSSTSKEFTNFSVGLIGAAAVTGGLSLASLPGVHIWSGESAGSFAIKCRREEPRRMGRGRRYLATDGHGCTRIK